MLTYYKDSGISNSVHLTNVIHSAINYHQLRCFMTTLDLKTKLSQTRQALIYNNSIISWVMLTDETNYYKQQTQLTDKGHYVMVRHIQKFS